MLLRIRMIIWKEFIQIFRDARMLAVVIALPVFMLTVFGYAINMDVKHVRMGVYDQSKTQQSRELVGAFSHSEYFNPILYPQSNAEIDDALDAGKVKVVLVIPVNYVEDLASGRVTPVQLLVDASDSTTATTAIGYIAGIIQQQSLKISLEAIQRTGHHVGNAVLPIDNRVRYWYNPELRSANATIPGLIATILMMLSALLTSTTVVRERERGTIESLIASPIMPFELMLGKLIPYVIIAFADVITVMLLAVFVFHVPLLGNPLYVLLSSAIFLFAALSIGLLISVVAPTQQVAMLGAMMGTQLPTIILSGFMFPITSMPLVIQWFTYLIPARHLITMLRGIFLKGSGFADIWAPGLALLLFGLLLFTIATRRFKKKL